MLRRFDSDKIYRGSAVDAPDLAGRRASIRSGSVDAIAARSGAIQLVVCREYVSGEQPEPRGVPARRHRCVGA